MARTDPLDASLTALAKAIDAVAIYPSVHDAVERVISDLQATRFHLNRDESAKPIVVLIGGTGTGKSTLFNRLIGTPLAATSFLRTFTAGPVLATRTPEDAPANWLGVAAVRLSAEQLPAAGRPDELMVVVQQSDLLDRIHLVDTPDLDGDKVVHHAQADRAFRWADGVAFIVTPEKYQMTELLPYYRLARRYGIAVTFVMNKVERQGVVDDYAIQLIQRGDSDGVKPFAVPRDDAAFEPSADTNLPALRTHLASSAISPATQRQATVSQRASDQLSRVQDQVVAPLSAAREEIDRIAASLRAMETPPAGVDVNPLTEALQRRLQQRSVLYLMGPNRMLDRVRQVPGLLARLPRTAWDVLRGGKPGGGSAADDVTGGIDFRDTLVDQFTIVQSRIDDVVRSSPLGASLHDQADAGYTVSRLSTTQASAIVDEEIANLQRWINDQWNATPRDTAMLKKLLKLLPGGEKLASWSEAAPYILAVVVAAHHAIFGPVDLMVMGGWSLATWLTEKVSNEVTSRARLTNRRISDRFTRLSHQQILATTAWLDRQAPTRGVLDNLRRACDDVQHRIGAS